MKRHGKIDPASLNDVEALEYSAELWKWLTDTGSDDKSAWPGWKMFTRIAINECFLCERVHSCDTASCVRYCLLRWCDMSDPKSPCHNSEFGKWNCTKTPRTRSVMAQIILTMHLDKLNELKKKAGEA